ncbi:MAG: SGNH/GDSL hydrolase family protein [Phycisphaerae bacterium]|nr:SGNH/GDSL hydrolase family protein [Phycisphaerae bacterium]
MQRVRFSPILLIVLSGVIVTIPAAGEEPAAPAAAAVALPHLSQKLQTPEGILIVALGDSVTKGSMEIGKCDFLSVYHNQLKRLLEERHNTKVFNVINAGIDGDDSVNGLRRLARDVLRFEPDLILIAFGLNDCAGRGLGGLDGFKANIQAMIDAIRKSGPADIILLTPNFMATSDNANVCEEHRRLNYPALMSRVQNEGVLSAYAEALREIGASNKIPVADVYAKWQTLSCAIDTNTMLSNGLNHPNKAGHLLTAQAIMQVIDPNFMIERERAQ